MAGKTASAPGKIILSGEYAVLFGHAGIAVPAPLNVRITYVADPLLENMHIDWTAHPLWAAYARRIADHCGTYADIAPGTLTVTCDIPLGKGMGSSTALIVAIAKCLLGEHCHTEALAIEHALNPGHSGLDFAVIWNNQPVQFSRGKDPVGITLPADLLSGALLIDTGEPHEQTPELIAWITSKKDELQVTLAGIGRCSEHLLAGKPLAAMFREHNIYQQQLGIVTDKAKELIKKIEQQGGAAKVIGAGARTGGCGMILAIDTPAELVDSYPVIRL